MEGRKGGSEGGERKERRKRGKKKKKEGKKNGRGGYGHMRVLGRAAWGDITQVGECEVCQDGRGIFPIVSGNHQKEAELVSGVIGQLGYWFPSWSLDWSQIFQLLKCTESITWKIKGRVFQGRVFCESVSSPHSLLQTLGKTEGWVLG